MYRAIGNQEAVRKRPRTEHDQASGPEVSKLLLVVVKEKRLYLDKGGWAPPCRFEALGLKWHEDANGLAEPSRIACEQCYMGTKVLPMTQLPEFAPQGLLRRLTISVELQVPVPSQSIRGDLTLTSNDGLAFRVHSQVLQLKSRVMADLLEEHGDQAMCSQECELRIPFKGSRQQLHLVLQAMYSCALPSLLDHWTLDVMQSLAAAGHRLHFSKDLCKCIEAAMVKAVNEDDKLAQLLAWALSVEYVALQKEVARLMAKSRRAVKLEECFAEDRLLVVVKAMQEELAERQALADSD